MGVHYRLTRRRRCIERITRLLTAAKTQTNEDLGRWKVKYSGGDRSINELLPKLEIIGYKRLLQVEHALESYASEVERWKQEAAQKLIWEAGRQGLTAEDVLILAGQQFPTQELFGRGGINLDWRLQLLSKPEQRRHISWSFLDELYCDQLRSLYDEVIAPRSQPH